MAHDPNDEPMGLLGLIDDDTYGACTCPEPARVVRLMDGRDDLGWCGCGKLWAVGAKAVFLSLVTA